MNSVEPCAPFPRLICRRAFEDGVTQRGFDPGDRWIQGYVAYEWCHARHVFEQSGVVLKSKRVLEFGCNFGATAIVLAHLGALVDAVDIDESAVEIATLNAAQYEVAHPIRFAHVSDSAALPFADAYFDAVICNSVLEYVDAAQLRWVQSALARVLKPGGLLLVLGTSNRFSPREVHSRRWLVNYLPGLFNSMLHSPGPPQRGVWPGALRRGFGSDFEDLDWHDYARAYLLARKAMGSGHWHITSLAAMALLARPFGWSVGMMTPNLSLRLRKKEVEAAV